MRQTDVLSALHNAIEVYHMICRPVCKQYELARTAFDILMFLANNPQYSTAKDITKYRGIQANLVSTYVEVLAGRGLLAREPIRGDRRRIRLTCTEQAGAIIEQGRRAQEAFFAVVCGDLAPEELEAFQTAMGKIACNLVTAKDALRKEGEGK